MLKIEDFSNHISIAFQQYINHNDHIKTHLIVCKKYNVVLKSSSKTQPAFKRL